ncbi:hypothetical protein KC660_00185 [Candidatus Dojkabacteria bacterium]|uniref:Uncharacterized protein n=1 Tax=Candidatus Dojkabacteria bacterium TaxID=2099670 RepID=A0A955RHY5_9BACT|nr:hypothetical protein [Candidatus Dojkabacteria bacterium]
MEYKFNYNFFVNILKLCGLSDKVIEMYLQKYRGLMNVKLYELILKYDPDTNKSLQAITNDAEVQTVLTNLAKSKAWPTINLELEKYMFQLIDDTLDALNKVITEEQKIEIVKYLDEYENRLDVLEKQADSQQ